MPPPRSARSASWLLALALVAAACESPRPRQDKPAPAAPAAPADLGGHKPGAHADHDPRYGGVVLMDGDVHFEVVIDRVGGAHKVYFTDAVREPLPATYASRVSMLIMRNTAGPESLLLRPDATGGFWTVQGTPVPENDAVVRVEYTTPDKAKPFWMDVPVSSMGKGPAKGPHQGSIQPTASGKIELVADRTGAFKVWLLDSGGATVQPAAGATARIKVAVAGYPEVALAVVGDHLEGKGPEINADHTTAVVIVDVGGKSETGRFALHLEGEGSQHP